MKILLVTTKYNGGAGIACRRQHQALLDNGFDSRLLVLDKVNAAESNVYSIEEIISQKKGKLYFKILKYANLLLNKVPVFFRKAYFINGPSSLFRIDKLEIYKEADIIHLHWVPKILSWKHVFADKQKKFFWTLHDMNPFTGGNHYTCDIDYSRFDSLLQKNISKKIQYVQGCKLKIISPSVWLANLARQSDVFKQFETVTIPNCVNLDIFKPLDKAAEKERLQLRSDKKVMLFVAEDPNDIRKGMQQLLQALKKIKRPEQVCLLIIGRHVEADTTVIETKQLGTIKSETELARIYNAADFFIIPSLEDNLPNTMVESLACGTPVLGFQIGGLPDLVINNKTGMLVPSQDVMAMASCIDQFIGMPDTSSYRLEARKRIEEKCSPKKMVQVIADLYQK